MLLNELYVNFNEFINLSKNFFVNSREVILPDVFVAGFAFQDSRLKVCFLYYLLASHTGETFSEAF